MKKFLLVIGLCWAAGSALANRVIVDHVAQSDPMTEGFSGGQAGSAVFGDMGSNAWNIQGPVGSFPRYGFNVSAIEAADMESTGFRVIAILRNTLAPDDAADLGNFIEVSLVSLGQFSLAIGADAAGNPTLLKADACCLGGTPIALNPAVTGSKYHAYELIYNPSVSLTEVELKVDGFTHGMLAPASSNFGNRFNWGGGTSSGTYNTNWNLVRLETDLFPPVVEPVPLLIGRHVGRNNPTGEGWTGGNGGGSAVTDSLNVEAWNMQTTGVFNRYNRPIPAEQVDAMLSKGWRARIRVRNLLIPDDATDLGALVEVSTIGLGQFSLAFGSSATGSPQLYQVDLCCLGGTEIRLSAAVTGTGYHLYEMVYDPAVSATQVALLVDGIPHGMLAPAASNFGDRFNFGAGDGGAALNANWNLVELTIGPDPPSLHLRRVERLGGNFHLEFEGPPETAILLERSLNPEIGFFFRSLRTTDEFGRVMFIDPPPIGADTALWRGTIP